MNSSNGPPKDSSPAGRPRLQAMPTFVDLDVSGFDSSDGSRQRERATRGGKREAHPPGFDGEWDPRTARRVRLVVRVSLVIAVSSLGLAAIRWGLHGFASPVAWALFTVALVAALTPVLRKLGVPLNVVATLAPATALGAAAVVGLLESGLHSEVAPWLPLIPLVAVLFLGRPGALGFGLVTGAVVALLVARSYALGDFAGASLVPTTLRAVSTAGAVAFASLLGWTYEHGREQTIRELAASEGRTAALIRAFPDMLVVLDEASRVLDTSVPPQLRVPAALALRQGEDCVHRMNEELGERVAKAIDDARRTGQATQVELSFDTVDTLREFEARVVPAGGGVLLLVLREVTEARAAQRVRDEFVSVVSHELRTPLTAIRGSIGLLQGLGAAVDDAQHEKMMAIANRNAERLGDLIDDLLDVQKIEAGRLRIRPLRVDVFEFLAQSLELNEGYARSHDVRFDLDTQVARTDIFADPERLGQVMANLLSNACKFSAAGEVVKVSAESSAEHVVICVEDFGTGIPTEFRPRMFSKFAQADGGSTRSSGGTGLGLHIARELVQRMRGEIWFESEVGVGTRFFVKMPRMRDA